MTETLLPNYLMLTLAERGDSLGISFEDYRLLARTALGATHDVSVLMAIYRLPEFGCALDIWNGQRCLTIRINPTAQALHLLLYEGKWKGVRHGLLT
jgi:hypothetical protein